MVTLSQRETQHLMILNALERGELRVADAATLLGRSIRQTQRLRSAYRDEGPAALVHGNRGRTSPRRIPEHTRLRLIALAQTTYGGVNFQHLSELLRERDGLVISRPSLHRILRRAGIRSPRTRRPSKHRKRRERMPQPGMLVLVDGSDHDWLEGRGPRLVLITAMDDASGAVLSATFREEEDAHGYFLAFRELTQGSGIPLATYSDRHGIFHRDKRRPLTLTEQLRGVAEPTQVGRMLQELGIRWIPASSPQAKGRIERLFQTFQDRLRVELRLAGLSGREEANRFLRDFLPRFNARFAHLPIDPTSAYRSWPAGLDPDTVFCFKYQRAVANDNTVALGPHRVQILPGPGGRSYAKVSVEIHERLDGTLAAFHGGQRLGTRLLTSPEAGSIPARDYRRITTPLSEGDTQIPGRSRNARPGEADRRARKEKQASRTGQPWKPPHDHPWKQSAREGLRRKELREAGVTFSLRR